MSSHILTYSTSEKKLLSKEFYDQWGINYDFKYDHVYEGGRNKIRIISQKPELVENLPYNFEVYGLYIAQRDRQKLIRLTIEGAIIFGPLATKNILLLDKDEVIRWFSGEDLPLTSKMEGLSDYIILKYNDNYLGCGKLYNKGIMNYVPKNRRVKEVI